MKVHNSTCHSDEDCVAGELDMLGSGQCAWGMVGKRGQDWPRWLNQCHPQDFGQGAVSPITMGTPRPVKCPPGVLWRMGLLSGMWAQTPLLFFFRTDGDHMSWGKGKSRLGRRGSSRRA